MAKKAVATLHEGSMDGRASILWHAAFYVVCGIHGMRIWK